MKHDDTRWISVGAGLDLSITAAGNAIPNGEGHSKNFDVGSIRLYVDAFMERGGSFTKHNDLLAVQSVYTF